MGWTTSYSKLTAKERKPEPEKANVLEMIQHKYRLKHDLFLRIFLSFLETCANKIKICEKFF